MVELVLAPCQVQGADAVRSVVASLRTLDRADVDVVVVARGGGAIEDLWAFNHEAVARAIAAVSAPVVSAIGHETDFTIADFVADVRAPTPSAAAELMVPDGAALATTLDDLRARAERAVRAQLWVAQTDLDGAEGRLRRALAAGLARAEGRLRRPRPVWRGSARGASWTGATPSSGWPRTGRSCATPGRWRPGTS